jgi:hypothetical protein
VNAAVAPVSTAEDLYGLDLAEFTAARDALSKQLRAAGDTRSADAVKRLRRPALTVWGLNQVARSRHELIVEALESGKTLQAAMMKVLEGDRSQLATAQAKERAAVDAAVAAVSAALGSAGHRLTDAAAQRVAATVRAGFADPEVERELSAGRLTEEHAAPGFGLGPDTNLPAAPVSPAKAIKTRQRREAEARVTDLTNEAARLGETARQLQQAAGEAERTAARARKEATRAEEAWQRAQRRAQEAAVALEED